MSAVFHWVRAAQYLLSAVPYFGPLTTDSWMSPFCLPHTLSRWLFSPKLLYCAVCFLRRSLHEVTLHCKCHWTFCSLCVRVVLRWNFSNLSLNSVKFIAVFELLCVIEFYTSLAHDSLRTEAKKSVSETSSPGSWNLVRNSSPLSKTLCKSSESPQCNRARGATNITTIGVSTLKALLQKPQACAPSPMPSSGTQWCLISWVFFESRVRARMHHMLFFFCLMWATFFSYASFSALSFFFSSLFAPLASGAGSLSCPSVFKVICTACPSVLSPQILSYRL